MEDLRRLKGRLESAMKITEGELQQSVFKCVLVSPLLPPLERDPDLTLSFSLSARSNYADFVLISKEIATLENEMLELKGVLEEWRSVPESLEGGWGDDDLLMGGKSSLPSGSPALSKLGTDSRLTSCSQAA